MICDKKVLESQEETFFFPDSQNDPVSFTSDSRDHRCSGHSQYKRPHFVVSDEGISHASCVPSKLTPYLLYFSIRSETQYIKISTLIVLTKIDLVYWSFVIIDQTTDVHLIFLCGIIDMIRKIFQTMKLSKVDFLDSIYNVYLVTFVISIHICYMWWLFTMSSDRGNCICVTNVKKCVCPNGQSIPFLT